jgi:LacI family transcriptional regulator
VIINTFVGFERQMVEGIIRFGKERAPHWEFEFQIVPNVPTVLRDKRNRWDAIIGYVDTSGPSIVRQLRQRKIPVVLIEQYSKAKFPVVRCDNRAIGRLAFEHLRGKAFRRFAYLGASNLDVFRQRGDGFIEAVHEAGLEFHPLPTDDITQPDKDPAMRAWMAALPKPIAIFAGNAEFARRTVALCRAAGALVPEEVAVLGVDNQPLECELSRPPLSTIDHGMERAGYEAAALVNTILSDQPLPASPVLVPPVGVIERQSTDTLAVDDAMVRAAVRLIRERATAGLTVKELMELIPVSRRKIEIGFREYLGRSLHDELTRVRLERAKFLLTTTEMSMPEIAAASGIQYASRLSEQFSRIVGSTPRTYRREHRRR